MELINLVDRKATIRKLSEPTAHVKQRIATAAEELSRAGDIAQHVEIANEALCKFTYMLYQKDTDGAWANVDSRTHRLLIPAPWGNAGWKRWGLRNWEAVVLRCVLMARLTDPRPPLFEYNTDSRTRFLNVSDYATLQAATFVLERGAITVAEWRKYSTAYHNRKATVQSAYRNRKTTV
jgi:hypothetical protein